MTSTDGMTRNLRGSRRAVTVALLAAAVMLAAGCSAATEAADVGTGGDEVSDAGGRPTPGGGRDTGRTGTDTGPTDTGPTDTTPMPDTGPTDTGPMPDTPNPDTGPDPDTTPTPDTTPMPDADPEDSGQTIDEGCAEVNSTAAPVTLPVDIIWAIDTSGSMDDEVAIIESSLNTFAEFIDASGLDYHVVMIADENPNCAPGCPELDVCVPPPLSGAPGCPDTDGDRYRHIREFVFSDEGLIDMVETYGLYSDFLRPGAVTHFVAVTDDESDRDASWFQGSMNSRFPQGYTFHSIVSLEEDEECILFICETIGCSGPHGDAEARGSEYMELSLLTDGIQANICNADWDPIFRQIAEGVIDDAVLACEYEIPDVGDGQEIVFDDVAVDFVPDGAASGVSLERVDSAAACTATGWYYDNNDAPTRIHICDNVCGDVAGSIDITFGCVKG